MPPCNYIAKTVRTGYHHCNSIPQVSILMKKLLDKIGKGGGFWFSLWFSFGSFEHVLYCTELLDYFDR